MKISSKEGTVVLDYYPLKSWQSKIFPEKYLRVLSFKGDIQNKRIVTEEKLDEEVRDRVDNYNYKITGNNDNLPQFLTSEVKLWLN